MRSRHVIGTMLLAALCGIAGGQIGLWLMKSEPEGLPKKETAYERVIRTQTLRCGYVMHPPHVAKDPTTGKLSGAIVDILNEAGRLLNIKVDWTEEVGWGNSVESLQSGRVDAICTDYWMNPVEGRYVGYSMPLYYETVVAYGRADDRRFIRNLDAVNDISVTVSATDGSINGIIAQQDFPMAKISWLPNMTADLQVLTEVESGKADIAFVPVQDGLRYAQANPGKLINLTPDRPLRAFPVTIALPQSDTALKTMLDSAFVQMLYGRFVDKTLDKHGMPADAVFRVARPYEVPAASIGAVLSPTPESVTTLPTQ